MNNSAKFQRFLCLVLIRRVNHLLTFYNECYRYFEKFIQEAPCDWRQEAHHPQEEEIRAWQASNWSCNKVQGNLLGTGC